MTPRHGRSKKRGTRGGIGQQPYKKAVGEPKESFEDSDPTGKSEAGHEKPYMWNNEGRTKMENKKSPGLDVQKGYERGNWRSIFLCDTKAKVLEPVRRNTGKKEKARCRTRGIGYMCWQPGAGEVRR